MTGTQLELGAQARGAALVSGAIEPIQSSLNDVSNAVQAASGGFKGSAAAGLATALEAWFEAAGDLLPTLNEYATNLIAVDVTEAQADQRQQQSYARLSSRLGGEDR
ncbi:MAG: hypothetical protein ACRDOY_11440 [Nocardioidaceae bacterium]